MIFAQYVDKRKQCQFCLHLNCLYCSCLEQSKGTYNGSYLWEHILNENLGLWVLEMCVGWTLAFQPRDSAGGITPLQDVLFKFRRKK